VAPQEPIQHTTLRHYNSAAALRHCGTTSLRTISWPACCCCAEKSKISAHGPPSSAVLSLHSWSIVATIISLTCSSI